MAMRLSEHQSPTLIGMNLDEIKLLVKSLDQPAFRATQIYEWIYRKAASNFSEMSNLPENLRGRLADQFNIGRNAPIKVDVSSDGTKKYLFTAGPGRFIEAAYIPEEDRATLCLSTQVGCKMGCLFCATGRQGFQSQLTAAQIINQYLSLPERETITNIVYMGMGEPFDNPQQVMKSLALFSSAEGIALSPRKITVSTVGIIPAMQDFLDHSEAHLAISIHSPFDEERRSLMPVQHIYPIESVIQELKTRDFSGQRRLSFEYIMFAEVNDSLAHARELVRILNGLRCRVNLIHYHSVPGAALQGSSLENMETFQKLLKEKGLIATIRRSRGQDIQAACGLLSTKELSSRRDEDF